jgi:hypothetical protein
VGFATDDSIKGIVRLLGIEKNAANELDYLLAKDVTDYIFFHLLVVGSICSMAPIDVYRRSENEEINQGVLCTSYARLWPLKHTMDGLSEEWGVNAGFELPYNTQQWDPGGRNMNFSNYCKRRASGRNNTTLEFSIQC